MFFDWFCGEHGKRRELTLYNSGDHEIPPYGACEITEGDRPDATGSVTPGGGRTRFHVKRPTEASLDSGKVLFNGPVAIAPGKEGPGFDDFPTYALYGGGGVPEIGDECGTQADSFELATGNTGFRVCGDIDEGAMLVKPAGGAVNTAYLKILGESEASENGDPVQINGNCLYSAEICTINTSTSLCSISPEPWEGSGQLAWVMCSDLTRPRSLVANEKYLGFKAGTFDPDPDGENSDSRPLYVVRVKPDGFPVFIHAPAKDAYSVYGVSDTTLERANGANLLRLYNPVGPGSLSADHLYATSTSPISHTGDSYSTIASDKPVRMLINSLHGTLTSSTGLVQGRPFGCMSGHFSLSPGLPGMMYVGGYDSSTNTGYFVRGNHATFWGKISSIVTSGFGTGSWNTGQNRILLKVNPTLGPDTTYPVYDGGSSAFPLVTVDVFIYYHEHQLPLVFVGDIIQYMYATGPTTNLHNFQTPHGAYLGPAAGTVRMTTWLEQAPFGHPEYPNRIAPRGWALMNGTDNTARSGINMIDQFPRGRDNTGLAGGSGGAETHTHVVSGAGGNIQTTSDAGSIASASHLPPYKTVYFIERMPL